MGSCSGIRRSSSPRAAQFKDAIVSVHALDKFGDALKADAKLGRNGRVILRSRQPSVSVRPSLSARTWTTTDRPQSQPLNRMRQQPFRGLKKPPRVRQGCVQFKRCFIHPFGMDCKHKRLPN